MRSVIPNLIASFVLFVIELSSNTFTTSSVTLTKHEAFILKFSDRAIITLCKRIIARYYSKSLKQLICVINQAWGQNGWITIPTVAPFPFFSFLFWSTFRALSRHSLWSFSILFFNADSSPKTAPRPLQSAPTSSHTDHMWISVTGACSNRIPPEVAAKQVHVIWTKIVTLKRPR